MNTPASLSDDTLGLIHIRVNVRARHLILRVGTGGEVVVTVPPGTPENSIRRTIEQYRDRLQRQREASTRTPIDEHFVVETPFVNLSFVESASTRFQLRVSGARLTLLYPRGTDFDTADMQEWLRKVITEALRRRAKEVLPGRIDRLSAACGLPFRSLKVNTSRGRWGSCSARKDINLSCFLMLLPEALTDYVILHELCHTVEMNHSPRFWALLDRYTDGRSKELRHALRAYRTDF